MVVRERPMRALISVSDSPDSYSRRASTVVSSDHPEYLGTPARRRWLTKYCGTADVVLLD